MTTFSRTAEQSVADRTPTPLALSMHPDGYMTDPTGELQVHFCDGGMIEIWAGGGFVRLDAGDLPLLIKAAHLLLPPRVPYEPQSSDANITLGSGVNVVDAMDDELRTAASQALDKHKYASEMPYFLAPDATEHEPLLLMLRAVYNLGRKHEAVRRNPLQSYPSELC